jgi:sugar lactone lactonase YvrE
MMLPELLVDAKASLGESPAWDAKLQTLYWVDILGKRLHAFDGKDHPVQLDELVSCLAPRRQGGLVLARRSGFWSLDTGVTAASPRGKLTHIASPKGEPTTNRFNDGKCDPRGRFVAGTMDIHEKKASGALYSLSPEGRVTKLFGRVRISNGLAWSPDHKTMYFIDTPSREVKAFDYDLETGKVSGRRVVIRFPETFGWPDGMTSDTDGHLWIALWGGARVSCWDPRSAQLLAQFSVPAWQVSSCVFGGAEMNELYITTARNGMSAAMLKKYPLSGGLFRMQTNVRGMETFEYAG